MPIKMSQGSNIEFGDQKNLVLHSVCETSDMFFPRVCVTLVWGIFCFVFCLGFFAADDEKF